MSGNNERVFDVPVCPTCQERPAFWILSFGESVHDGWLWLFSKKYLSKSTFYETLHKGSNPSHGDVALENIGSVACRVDNDRAVANQHTFRLGHPVFNSVISYAEKYWDEMGGVH